MIVLSSVNDLIKLIANTGNTFSVQASWVDVDASNNDTPGRLNSLVTSGATVNIVPSPGAGLTRIVKTIQIYNSNASAVGGCIVQHTDGTNLVTLYNVSATPKMPVNGSAVYSDGVGWKMLQGDGTELVTAPSGTLLYTVMLTSTSSQQYQVGPYTNKLRVYGVGGGGGGGGTSSVASAAGAGAGGGGGAYTEDTFGVNPGAIGTYLCGAGGAGTANAGANGANSTFLIGAVSLTALGGTGGARGVAATTVTAYKGGAGGTASAGGLVNGGGAPGLAGICPFVGSGTTEILKSGAGGNAGFFGGGEKGLVAPGSAPTGNTIGGSGGAGAACGASASNLGATGANGFWIVEEYA